MLEMPTATDNKRKHYLNTNNLNLSLPNNKELWLQLKIQGLSSPGVGKSQIAQLLELSQSGGVVDKVTYDLRAIKTGSKFNAQKYDLSSEQIQTIPADLYVPAALCNELIKRGFPEDVIAEQIGDILVLSNWIHSSLAPTTGLKVKPTEAQDTDFFALAKNVLDQAGFPDVFVPAVQTDTKLTAEPHLELIALLEAIQKGATPMEFVEALQKTGWATPEKKIAIEEALEESKTTAERATSENLLSRSRLSNLDSQLVTLKEELTETQRKLADSGISSAELTQKVVELNDQIEIMGYERLALQTQIEALKTQIGGETQSKVTKTEPIIKPKKTEEIKSDKKIQEEFKTFCDSLIGKEYPKEKEEVKQGLSNQSRIETQTTYLNRNQSNLNPRFGLYRIINSMLGNSTSTLGDPVTVSESVLGTVTTEQAKQIGDVIELLAQGDTGLELTRFLVEGLVGAREYYDYSKMTEVFFVGVLPQISSKKNFKKDKFYMNVPNLLTSISAIEKTLSGLPIDGRNELLVELKKSFKSIQTGKLVRDLNTLSRTHTEIFKEDYSFDLETVEIESKKASNILIKTFEDNKDDCVILNTVCQKLATLLPLANYHKEMTSRLPIENPRVKANGDGLKLEDARNPYAVLLSAATGGRYLGSEQTDWYQYFRLNDNVGWPPRMSYNNENFQSALKNEQPISLKIDPDKPIILLTGNNGAGKTRAMETVAQTVAHALVTGTNDTARVLNLSQMREIRSLVGAARHTVELSSFQREALLIADALKTLSNKPQGERAILIVDEVGKGTDSRDAISLMTAVSEYCRRNNIYLLMATHHGKDFVNLAGKLGLRESMTILSPDFGTHKLNEYEEAVSSKGVEVMQTRASDRNIPKNILDVLIENAQITRQAVLEDNIPKLKKIASPESGTSRPIGFIDLESLQDIGFGLESERNHTFTFKPLLDKAYKFNGFDYGETNDWFEVQSKWETSFLDKWKEIINMNDQDLSLQNKTMRVLVDFLKIKDNLKKFTKLSGESFHSGYLLFGNPFDAEDFSNMSKEYDAYIKDFSNGFYLGSSKEDAIKPYLTMLANQEQRKNNLNSVKELQALLNSPTLVELDSISRRLGGIVKLYQEFDDIILAENTKNKELLLKHLRSKAVEAIKTRLDGYEQLSMEDAKELSELLGKRVTTPKNFFEIIVKNIESGDNRVYFTFCKWLIEDRLKNDKAGRTSYDAKSLLFSDSHLESIYESSEKIEENHEDIIDLKILGPSLKKSANFKNTILNAFINEDIDPLISLTNAANNAGVIFISNSEMPDIINNLEFGKFYTWQKHLTEHRGSNLDYFKILNVDDEASIAEIKKAARNIAKKYHPDLVTPLEWQGKDLSNAPKEVFEKVERARAIYDPAMEAESILTDETKRSIYDRARNIKTLFDLSYYSTMTNAIIDMNWGEATYSTDGSFDLSNSISLGLLANMDKSEIVRQSLSFNPETESVVIGGSNGNGKSQLLIQLASAFEWAKTTGYVPADYAVLPKINFISCMVNAGESTEGKSSFQNEIDRYLSLVDRYVKAGSPTDGIIFLDEPLAGTSSEDQIGILLSMIEFFRQRDVKVIFTNHNHKMYEFMRRTNGAGGEKINFKPVAFLTGKDKERFKIQEFDSTDTDAIRSDGIKVAGELGVANELIQIAYFARKTLTGTTGVN